MKKSEVGEHRDAEHVLVLSPASLMRSLLSAGLSESESAETAKILFPHFRVNNVDLSDFSFKDREISELKNRIQLLSARLARMEQERDYIIRMLLRTGSTSNGSV